MSGIARNLMGPYPRGVPSPRTVHVHPYPTRYHGTINRRPMFQLPFQWQPHAVFKPDDFNRREPPMQATGSLQYNTGRGIFMPKGNGGGIFDENISGLGNAGLGYSAASLPWLTYSADTVEFQKDLNKLLSQAGKATVAEDGKLGPKTCAACNSVPDCRPVPTSCSQASSPSPSPAFPSQSTVAPALPSPGMSRSTKNAVIFVGAGVAALGVAYFALRQKKKG